MTVHTVEVTAEDITNGEQQSCTACPVALALKRHFPNSTPIVDVDDFSLHQNGEATIWHLLPDEVESRIIAFDAHGTMEPFTFEVTL